MVCDRFSDSSVAYQGVARGLGVERVEEICDLATGGVWPDLTILLRIDPDRAAERIGRRRADRFEGEGIELQRRVAEGYDEVARRHPERIRVIDADGERDAVHAAVLAEVAGGAGRDGSGAARSSRSPRRWPKRPGTSRGRGRPWRRRSPHPATPTSSAGRGAPARRPRPERSPPSCSPTAPRTRRMPAGARCSIPRPTPTSSGCVRPGAQHLVEDVRESVIRAASLSPAEGSAASS